MSRADRRMPDSFTQAVKAINNLLQEEFGNIDPWASREGSMAHSDIEHLPVGQKAASFYRHFLPLRTQVVTVLAASYRRYFKLALARADQTGNDPDMWAQIQLSPAIETVLNWMREWYILACEGENQGVRRVGSVPFVPGQTVSLPIPTTLSPLPPATSWRAPAWLFEISPSVGVGPLKEKHVPANDTEERLGEAHTRLLLKGAKRAFFWELRAAIETVRNEEIAAAGAVREAAVNGRTRQPIKRKGWRERLKLYSAIQRALSANPTLQGIDLCAELDKRHAPPLVDWKEGGEWREGLTWKEAWGNLQMRRKIRRVRQEAQRAI